ncbi:bifunctional hydroxymethylpyrimidine kinase/phosphomethylpyrimidine kinase [Bacillus tuaregi]|uniref:bifunctional hydroxymethylpyrimidine kinase/phosphomethylpyrimidine kinase n=1 Tax=Bacillus tuaregi TaxID=1816695 RepID=UPI0008F8DFE9|nr:bifunctional hydroxymethylpyrimidine kinase/phosphomethylpyrimidine kinase [Bacillus tuaregi]
MYKALTIAGSDSGGGAGVQADLKTFQELNVFGMTAITAVTAQNTLGVQGVQAISKEMIASQIDSVAVDLGVDALKTGMLFSSEIIQTVAEKIQQYGWEKVVVDPVMIAKGGATLLQQEAITAVKEYLLPQAYIVTPNIPEAEELTGIIIQTEADKLAAAKKLIDFGVKHVIIKGGHDSDVNEAVDLLFDGHHSYTFTSQRIQTKNTHGTGCTFSAAITACLAKGLSVYDAVSLAKSFITAAIEENLELGTGHGPTNHWAFKQKAGISC